VLVDGTIAVLEEEGGEDQIWSAPAATGTAWEPIPWEATTRSYTAAERGWSRGQNVTLAVGTLGPAFSVYCAPEGAGEERTVRAETTFSAVKYRRPAWQADWNATNVNADFETPYREDYTVALDASGVGLGGNLAVGVLQETLVQDRLPATTGRGIGYRVANRTGWCELRQLTAELSRGGRRNGLKS
jgi:hypothetical protein